MTPNQSRLLGIALLLAVISGVMFLARLANAPDATTDSAVIQEALARKHAAEQAVERSRARLEGGAYVLRRKQISDTEVIETIVIPESLVEDLDTRCIVYKNSDLRTSSITCAGVVFRQPVPSS